MRNVRKISKKYCLRQIVACWLVSCLFFGMPMVARAVENPLPGALPSYTTQGVDYDIGAGSIGTIVPGLNSLTINSVANGTVIYLNNHDIGSLASVTYNQGAGNWALVKINDTLGSTFYGDGAATGIAGSLTATGNFIISNSEGIYSAPSSYIHAQNLVLSAMRISDTDFGQFAVGNIEDLKFDTQVEDGGLVTINGEIHGAESVYIAAKNIENLGTISSPGGCVVMAAGNSARIGRPGSEVVVQVAMAEPANHVIDNDGIIDAPGGKVILAAGDIWSTAIEGVESLRAEAKRDITLEGAVSSTGDITLAAGHNVDLAANKTLTTNGNLTIEATSGEIMAETSVIDMAGDGKTLSLKQNAGMDLEQDFFVDNRINTNLVAHSTGGSVVSDAAGEWGSITAHAADNITLSDISEIITTGALEADIGDVKVTSIDGKVEVYGPVSAGQDVIITATDEGLDGTEDAISLYGAEGGGKSVVAGRDIWLNNNTFAAAGYYLAAGQDVRIGWQGEQDPWDPTSGHYDPKTLTGAGALTVEADRDITLGGNVAVSTEISGDLVLKADADTVNEEPEAEAGGDMTAYGTIDNLGGDIDIYAADNTIYLWDNVTALGDIILHNNTVVKAAGKKLDSIEDDVVLAADKTLDSDYDLTINAGDDILLGVTNVDQHWIEQDIGSGGDVSAAGNLTLDAGDDVYAHGTLTTTNGGDIEIYSSDSTTYLYDDYINADGSILLNNATESWGDILAGQDVKLNSTLELKGTGLDADQSIRAENGQLYANDSIHKTTAGNLNIFGGYNGPLYPDMDYSVMTKAVTVDDGELSIAGNATVRLDGSIYSSGDMTLAANADGILSTPSKATPTSPLYSYDQLIHNIGTIQSLNGDVDLSGINIALNGGYNPTDAYVSAGGDILIRNYTWVQYSRKLDAGDDIVLAEGKRLQGNGSLSLAAGDDIIIGSTDVDNHWLAPEDDTGTPSEVKANGDLMLNAVDDVYVHGELITLDGSGGDIEITASDDTIHLYGNVTADQTDGGDIILHANTEVVDGVKLDAGDDVVLAGGKSITGNGNLTLEAGDDILLGVTNVDSHWVNQDIGSAGDVTANGDLILDAGDDIHAHGQLSTDTDSGGNITATAGDDIHLYNTPTSADADGTLTLTADSDDNASGNLTADGALYGNMSLSGVDVTVYGDVESDGILDVDADGDIVLKANVSSVGEMTMDAGSDIELNGNSGNTSSESTISLNAGDSISVGRPFSGEGNVAANGNMDLIAGTDSGDNVKILGKLTTTNGGNINVEAGGDIKLYGTFNGPYFESAQADGDLTLDAEYDVDVLGDLISNNGSIDIYSSDDTTYLGGDVFAAYDVTLHNNTILDGGDSQIIEAGLVGNGTMTAGGWLWKTTAGHLYLGGYNSEPEHRDGKAIDLQYAGCLPAASTCLGNLDLYAPDGDIQISGDLTTFGICDFGDRVESTENGSCWEYWYDRPTGGVSVIAENGKIYTAADSPDPAAGDYMLNIGISGNSDDVSHRMVPDNGYEYVQIDMPQLGVDIPELPWFDEGEGEDGKAAIVVLSRDDLIFGPDTMLIAKGNYDSSVVDDRPEVDFLADPLTSIGGIVRDEGDQIDVAIYAGSMGTEEGQGNVHLNGRAIDVAEAGTMVVDAYDTVTFGDFDTFNLENLEGCKDLGCFFMKLAMRFHEENLHEAFGQYVELNGWYEGVLEDFLNDSYDEDFFFNIDRLEVVSRITEWLFQASDNGTLPYPYNPGIVEAFIGGEYVLRGAGLDNPDILDGRAWVLEDPMDPAPLYEEAGEAAEKEEFGEGGCPALMDWLADEIGVPAEDIQVAVAGAFALSTDVQPCEMCARLMGASNILQDVEGTQIASLARVVNEFVTAAAPPSPEQMTSIAAAMAEHVDDGTHYAAAGEWIDALVAYIGIMKTEMGYSATDAAAFAEKYLTRVNESGNEALIAYVQARLAALGG